MENIICPYCKKREYKVVKSVVYSNVEHYGDHIFDLPCQYCKKMIRVYAYRIVRITGITKSDKPVSESDF